MAIKKDTLKSLLSRTDYYDLWDVEGDESFVIIYYRHPVSRPNGQREYWSYRAWSEATFTSGYYEIYNSLGGRSDWARQEFETLEDAYYASLKFIEDPKQLKLF